MKTENPGLNLYRKMIALKAGPRVKKFPPTGYAKGGNVVSTKQQKAQNGRNK
jgi:hypothetical protein